MKEAAARVEEAVSTALATVRERQEEAADSEGSTRPGGRSSHAAYVQEESMQRVTSVRERASRQGSSDNSYGIS